MALIVEDFGGCTPIVTRTEGGLHEVAQLQHDQSDVLQGIDVDLLGEALRMVEGQSRLLPTLAHLTAAVRWARQAEARAVEGQDALRQVHARLIALEGRFSDVGGV